MAARRFTACQLLVAALTLAVHSYGAAGETQSTIDYNRDIRPLFRRPLPQVATVWMNRIERPAFGWTLETKQLRKLKSGSKAVVPGRPDQSELIARVAAQDDDRMPPESTGDRLSASEIQKLRAWIREGAKYAVHWSFSPQVRHVPPSVRRSEWVRNPIDAFIFVAPRKGRPRSLPGSGACNSPPPR